MCYWAARAYFYAPQFCADRVYNDGEIKSRVSLFTHADQSERDLLSTDSVQWADGYLLVYSILDKASFDYVKQFRRHVLDVRGTGIGGPSGKECSSSSTNNPVPCVLLANKADMVHLRQVTSEEGTHSLFLVLSASKIRPCS